MESKKKSQIFFYIVFACLVLLLYTGGYPQLEEFASSLSRCDWKFPTAFDAVYYAGLALCGVQGATLAGVASASWITVLPVSALSAFGGGFTRDALLQVHPAVLTQSSLPGLCTAIGASLFFSRTSFKTKAKFRKLFPAIDAFSLGTFIAYGVEAAQAAHAPPLMMVLCGMVTALGGGILSKLLCCVPIRYVLLDAPLYRATVFLGSLLYSACLDTLDKQAAHHVIIFYTGITVLATDQGVRRQIDRALNHPLLSVQFALSYTKFVCLLIALHSTYVYCRLDLGIDTVHSKPQKPSHRIRIYWTRHSNPISSQKPATTAPSDMLVQ